MMLYVVPARAAACGPCGLVSGRGYAPSMTCRSNYRGDSGRCGTRTRTQLGRSVQIVRDTNGVVVVAQLPGFSKSDVTVEVVGNELTVFANKAVPKADPSPRPSRVHCCERPGHTTYRQTFRLGDHIETAGITANMETGVLTITLPYKTAQERGPRAIPVEGPASPADSRPASPPAAEDVPGPSATAGPDEGWVAVQQVAAQRDEEGEAPAAAEQGAAEEGAAEQDGSVEDCEY